MIKEKKSSFVSSSFKVLALKIIGIIFQFTAMLILTNNGKDKIFGEYNYLNTILLLISAFCLLGLNNSILQFSGRLEAENQSSYLRVLYRKKVTIISLNVLLISSIYFVLTRVLEIKFFQDELLLGIYDKLILILFPFSMALFNFQYIRALGYLLISEFFINVIRFGLILILSVFLLLTNQMDQLLEWYIVTIYIIFLLSTGVVLLKIFNIPAYRGDFKIGYGKILNVSFPMSFSFISLMLMQSVDVFILESYETFETVAYYGVAVKITTGIGIVLSIINSVVAPQFSNFYYSNQFNKLKELVSKSVVLNFSLTLPLILIIIIFSKYILSYFGTNYTTATVVLIIMTISQTVNAFCGSVGVYLNMTGRQNVFLIIIILALMLNVVFNLVLVPKYGMTGAAIGTGISLISWNVFGAIYILRKDNISLFFNPKDLLQMVKSKLN